MAQDVIKAPTERAVPRLTRREGLSLIINSDPLGIPLRLARKYGDVFFMEAGGQKVFFLNHPDDVRELLVVQHEKFYKGDGVMQLARMLGQGLVTSEDPLHKRQRRLVQPAFHRKRIAGYAQAMVEAAQEQARNWRDGATVDMVEEMMELTLIIVGKTLFNTDVAREADTVQQALVTSMEAFRKLSMSPLGALVERLPLPINARLRQAREQLDAVVYRIIDEHRKQGKDQGDLLSMLLLAQDEDGSVMTDQQLRDEVMTLFLAGHETTSNALAWTWYLLAQHPEILSRLQQEVDSVLADRAASIDDLPRLPYTEQILMESMRIRPPSGPLTATPSRTSTCAASTSPRAPRSCSASMSYSMTHASIPSQSDLIPSAGRPRPGLSGPSLPTSPLAGDRASASANPSPGLRASYSWRPWRSVGRPGSHPAHVSPSSPPSLCAPNTVLR
ncbi:hypothetical protein KSB_65860 [Ktedonobacter robiniae]|uniref:Cytochrome P450 n=1 Tax=Ktedonobacter robiniae TaxID=2778365 RepID=A0ABQ3UZG9_9CHLR|nr:hypothetical protein KSB_65860 [Ktedonobacter robiniae]